MESNLSAQPHLFADHIQQIMTLEESVQHVVMTAIQEVSATVSFSLV